MEITLTPEKESELCSLLGDKRDEWYVGLVAGSERRYWAWKYKWSFSSNTFGGTWENVLAKIRIYEFGG